MRAFAADFKKFEAAGAQILGVSQDDPKTQGRFKLHCAAPFPLLSDQGGKVANAYGIAAPLGLTRRTTFLIDERGIVRAIVPGMPDNASLLATLRSWPPTGASPDTKAASPPPRPQEVPSPDARDR